ncbi:MAG TPA: DUF4276 family protein [Pirellulales bacterium]|nr:DUF4276 family protein [Pirellulales bacterium]
MIRLYFYVEGQTEQAYVDRVLKEHLARFGVMVEGAILVSTGKRRGVVHRGGGRRYAPMKTDLQRLLRQHRTSDVRFTTMIDLYALYSDFPGTGEANKLRHIPRQRVQMLENAFSQDIGDLRLIPHIQLHEFETILFCDPDAFAFYYEDCSKKIDALKQIAAAVDTPEQINDGQHTAPSKRIAGLFPDYSAAKPDAPSVISEAIDLRAVREKCSYFNEWLSRLEQLSQSPPC